MLQVRGLSCERGRRQLFSALDFSLGAGQLLQIVGNNGSGKTTLLKILIGLYTDFDGEVDWSIDQPPLYFSHRPGLKNELTVLENLRWLCVLQGLDPTQTQIDHTLEIMGLAGYQDTLCANLSEGQRKRVGLARFWLSENACWVMDEPFSSIDVTGLARLQTCLQEQADRGGSVIFTSHQPVSATAHIEVLDLSA
jgi:heme exporter protein A